MVITWLPVLAEAPTRPATLAAETSSPSATAASATTRSLVTTAASDWTLVRLSEVGEYGLPTVGLIRTVTLEEAGDCTML